MLVDAAARAGMRGLWVLWLYLIRVRGCWCKLLSRLNERLGCGLCGIGSPLSEGCIDIIRTARSMHDVTNGRRELNPLVSQVLSFMIETQTKSFKNYVLCSIMYSIYGLSLLITRKI
ncbi:hypothetical protein M432DRAFT_8820 [Thermoascus aurantiacus ATCC 26904]